MAKAQEKVPFTTKLKQLGQVFTFTAKQDKWFLPLVAAAVLLPLAVTIVVCLAWNWLALPIGLLVTVLAVLVVLNLRAGTAMLSAAEGQPGAAASVIDTMRGDWRVKPAVSSTTQFDMVHLVIGRPGVILLGEGDAARVRSLISQEKKRLGKVVGSAPIYDYLVGRGEGELPLRKLRLTLTRLPRNLTARDVRALDQRLKALTARPQLPKGAIPRNMRPPKGAFRAQRGR
ncbi:hypothetical protein GCM10010123_12880 [Pilimelia anulata]|uniref:DUF4191 domain-containing protein n=1 Tax=Pilimelia anulata TaxID=53371 RepID=A0A8J3B0Q6_9ACTN|nr:DUF4191 domain-containing protein [Pilimelia anulata]GGJ84670.1 hypothetical protein GCM10010123_12880 [Pilimelia anulata]